MRAPEAPGTYELRYLTGQSQNVLASLQVEVTEAVVTVSGPTEVAVSSFFEMVVEGAIGPQDAMVLVRVGDPDQGAQVIGPARRVYGSRVQFRAPEEAGDYEIRYLAGGASGEIVVRWALSVR